MSKKIFFNVVFVSDEEPNFPANELLTHNPDCFGWQSDKSNSSFPKEIVLRFHSPSKIYKIQVLAHQFIIPERIEIWLNFCKNSTPSSQSFEYMGFIELSPASSNYQSRELQSVNILPKLGSHLKLRMTNSHPNILNTHSQLALIAINLLGEPCNNCLETIDPSENSPASICDDLALTMYCEKSIVEVIRTLESRKLKAVSEERFEFARKLKLCMNALKTAGERLGRYSLAKRQAVQQEDFNVANLRKEQIEMYKNSVFEKLQVDQLLEKEGEIPTNDLCSEIYASKPILPSPPSLLDVFNKLAEKTISSPKTSASSDGNESSSAQGIKESQNSPQLNLLRGSPIITGSLRRRNKSAPRNNNNYEEFDNQTIPTMLRHSHTNEYLRECQGSESENGRGRSKLNDRERRQAAIPILVFGLEVVELFYSRQFQDREEALIRIRNVLKQNEEPDFGYNKIARATSLILHRGLREPVFSVFNQAAETTRCLFVEFVPNKVTSSEVARCVDRLLPELLAKSGDASARVHLLAQHTILSIATCCEVKEQHLVAPAISRPLTNGTHPRLALSRMQMLEQLVLAQGISQEKQSGLSCRTISECGCSGIHHAAESVRKVAERVILLVYQVNPRLVRKQLPPDDIITRRNLLYRQLFAEFDKYDKQRKQKFLDEKHLDEKQQPMSLSMFEPQTSIGTIIGTKKPSKPENSVSFSHTRSPSLQDSESAFKSMCLTENSNSVSKNFENKKIQKSKSGNSINQTHTENGKQSLSVEGEELSINLNENDLQCPFCNWICQGNSSLDRHYWKYCPILTKCLECGQVLEVANLNFHFINDCETKARYEKCNICGDAVLKDLIESHELEDHCRESTEGISKCPLCYGEVYLPKENGWKRHLLKCSANIKRRSKNN